MTEFAARIGRVTLRGGASLSILTNAFPDKNENDDPENYKGVILRHAKQVADYDEPGSRLDGFVIVGLFDDGSASFSFRIPSRIPQCLAVGYITEILRRDMITSRAAEQAFDRKFEWRDA